MLAGLRRAAIGFLLLATTSAVLCAQPDHNAKSIQPAAADTQAFRDWEEAVYRAAEVALQAVSKQAGRDDLSLRQVPLETLQVYHGRQHSLGLSIDGIHYDLVLGNEHELTKHQQAAAGALPAGQQQDSQLQPLVASGLVQQHWREQGSTAAHNKPTLPDVALSGPLELVLSKATPVGFFTPHAADAGPVKHIRLGAGVTIRLAGLKSIQLRQPLDMPNLPAGYLAEVYAHAQLKDPGEDFDKAPGVHYLAQQLRHLALNTTLPLLSFNVVPADESAGLSVTSVDDMPGAPTPRLKLKRTKDGSVELSLRQSQIRVSSEGGSEGIVRRATALARPWAWPLPHLELSDLVPYEALLRSILAMHPFDLSKVQRHGISFKVTKSEIRGTRLMAFEMELRSKSADLDKVTSGWEGYSPDTSQLLVFDVVVSVQEGSEQSGRGPKDLVYVPVSVKLKEMHGSTMTLSQSALTAMLYGHSNETAPVPVGYDHEDLGIAQRQAGE